jgi:hypothetical protein
VSAYHYLFIRTDLTTEDFLNDVAAATGSPVLSLGDEVSEDIDYASEVGSAAVDIALRHDFEDEPDIPMSEYPIHLAVRDYERDMDRQETTARAIFDSLCSRGKYSVMLVFDLQRLVAKC